MGDEKMNDELGFERFTKRQLVKFCKKFHKDCYRLVGQKMKLKDQLAQAKEIIRQFLNDYPVITKEVLDKLEQFIKETE